MLKSVFKRKANYLSLVAINFQMKLPQQAGFQTQRLVQAEDSAPGTAVSPEPWPLEGTSTIVFAAAHLPEMVFTAIVI